MNMTLFMFTSKRAIKRLKSKVNITHIKTKINSEELKIKKINIK